MPWPWPRRSARWRALVHEALSGGRRDFVSASRIEADRYDLQVDADSADNAAWLLDVVSGGRPD